MKTTSSLNTTNPDHLTYESGVLQISILGGIRLEGLDRMRATLKIGTEEGMSAVRHNLDLYNDTQTEKLIRKTAERLELGTSIIATVLENLTDALEAYRLEEIEAKSQIQYKRKLLSPEETKEAQAYLKAPNLIARTKEDKYAVAFF